MKKFLLFLWTLILNPMYSPLDLLIIPVFWILIVVYGLWWFFGMFVYLVISAYMTNKYFNSATLRED